MRLEMFEDNNEEISLPHPRLPIHVHLIIEAAICATWELIIRHGRKHFDLSLAHEDEVTLELQERLYDEIFNKGIVEGFDREIFTSVHREPKIRNYNRLHPDKMPDLFVDFVDRPAGVMNSQHGLFIECKPVDRDHPVGSAYCDEGLIRFVRGDYAWTMQSAMMIGYARAGYCLDPKLMDALSSKRKTPIPTLSTPEHCQKTKATSVAEQVFITKHSRTFNYMETGLPAGIIVIRHLWLKRDNIF